jgi:hypothetical protein
MVHGDRFILCSDGLVDEVHDDDIATIAVEATDPQECADRLIAKANANGGRDNVTVVVVDVLQGVEPTGAGAGLESEPGWPGSETTGTMIDADANSVLSAGGIIADDGTSAPVVHAAGTDEAGTTGRWGTRRFLKLVGAAAILTVIITLIAVIVHNTGTVDPTPTTVAVTEPATTPSTSPASTTSTISPNTTSSPTSTTRDVTTSSSVP